MRSALFAVLLCGLAASANHCSSGKCDATGLLQQVHREAQEYTIAVEKLAMSSQEYTPGDSGAAWSSEEIAEVKGWLWNQYDASKTSGSFDVDLVANAPRALRVAFHDCLLYEDGSGGCDGCMQLTGLQDQVEPLFQSLSPSTNITDNHGIQNTLAWLEDRYNEGMDSAGGLSLKQSGKSRADLWAFAALVAVDYTVAENNYWCNQASTSAAGSHRRRQCLQKKVPRDATDCQIEISDSFVVDHFRPGRSDCIVEADRVLPESEDLPYNANREEIHPSQFANGPDTVAFFHNNFDFSVRETVAIMGVHTIGRFHQKISGFKYRWSTSDMSFNNQYYRNLVSKEDCFFQQDWDPDCTCVTDAFGGSEAAWKVKANTVFENNGPVQWIQEKYVCPNCPAVAAGYEPWWSTGNMEKVLACCGDNIKENPDGTMPFCKTDREFDADNKPIDESLMAKGFFHNTIEGVDFSGELLNANGKCCKDKEGDGVNIDLGDVGCEEYRFIFASDEAAMNSDMGLYLGFDVDENGFPYGEDCEREGPPPQEATLENFAGIDRSRYPGVTDPSDTSEDRRRSPGITRRRTKEIKKTRFSHQTCSKEARVEEDGKKLHEFVEMYADGQQQWFNDFVPALLKMLRNGPAAAGVEVTGVSMLDTDGNTT